MIIIDHNKMNRENARSNNVARSKLSIRLIVENVKKEINYSIYN